MDINAKQIPGLEIGRLDNATLLAYMNAVAAKAAADTTLTTKMGAIYTTFAQAATAYDQAYNPSYKDLLSDQLATLDEAHVPSAQGLVASLIECCQLVAQQILI